MMCIWTTVDLVTCRSFCRQLFLNVTPSWSCCKTRSIA